MEKEPPNVTSRTKKAGESQGKEHSFMKKPGRKRISQEELIVTSVYLSKGMRTYIQTRYGKISPVLRELIRKLMEPEQEDSKQSPSGESTSTLPARDS